MKIQKGDEDVLLLNIDDVTHLYNYFKKTVIIPVAYPKGLGYTTEYIKETDYNTRFMAALKLIVDKE